jgi:hypothetical protein
VKFIAIGRLAPGVENGLKSLQVFLKAGLPEGTQATYAAADGKTFIYIFESDAPDMVASYTYSPFYEEFQIFPVVDVDEKWLQAAQAAQASLTDRRPHSFD